MKEIFTLKHAYEQKARLVKVNEAARERLTPKEFELFGAQLEEKINQLDKVILDQERLVLAAMIPGLVGAVSYASFCVTGTTITPRQASVLIGSPSSSTTFLVGFQDLTYPDQGRLPWPDPADLHRNCRQP